MLRLELSMIKNSFKPGWKFNEYEVKGVPIRISVGMRDIENSIEIFRRDTFEKSKCNDTQLISTILQLLKKFRIIFIKKQYLLKITPLLLTILIILRKN